ncbi:hypothetical protein UlMin_035103 [Ulmus minor]
MDSTTTEVSLEVFPYLRLYKDGTLERLAGTQVAPAGLDPQTGVLSKDVVIIPETSVSVRLYRPNIVKPGQKLPIAVYFHGGGFFISSIADPVYHNSLNRLVNDANIIVVSVGYRLAPEHPLPAAYDDCWAALHWITSHSVGTDRGEESWLADYVDFDRVFLAGDSCGANIAHHMVCRVTESDPKLKISGIVMIHPYFWGKKPIGSEVKDTFRREMVDRWWFVVCPSEKGNDDPLINPFADGAPKLEGLTACRRILVLTAEKDILRDRGWLYYEKVRKSAWGGKIEIEETEGEDHIFHILNPNTDESESLINRLASFINQC